MDQYICKASSNKHRGYVRSYKPAIPHILEPLETFSKKHIKEKDLNYCIEKLDELILDPINQDNKSWICRLLNKLRSKVGIRGYKMKHLPAVMQILEFLALKVQNVPEYEEYLDMMLDLCIYPPLLEKSSDHLSCFDILVHYFTIFGYLLAIVPYSCGTMKVLEAIRHLLTRSIPVEISAVKLEYLHRAVEKSRLPLILTDFIQISSLEILGSILDTTFIVASVSNSCCHRMLDAGIFNYLLLRFAELTSLIDELDDNFFRTHINEKIVTLTNVIWLIIKSILPPLKLPSNLKNMPAPDNNAMSAILNSGRNKQFLLLRNDLAAIILGGIMALPKWHLVNCDIAEDIIAAAIAAIESKEIQAPNDEDFIFKKTLFFTICYFSDSSGLLGIIREKLIIAKIIQHLNYHNASTKMPNRNFHFSYLMSYKLQTLAILASKMPDEFVEHGGPTKLLMIFDLCAKMKPMIDRDIMEIIKTIGTICLSKSPILLMDFNKAGAIPKIYEFIKETSILNEFLTPHQRILTLLIMVIECIMKNKTDLIEIYDNETIDILITIMRKCQGDSDERKNNFPVDERLLIAIASHIGECIVWYPSIVRKFIIASGIYIMLDIMENASLLVRNTFLKTLIDLCTNSQCIPYLCTWRNGNKTKGFLSLLASSWREEESNCGVKRTGDGCIEDVEFPLMGSSQWYNSFHSRMNHDFSPTLTSMIGSIRPKIYSIRKMLLTNSEICERTKNHYKILVDDLPIEDAITFCIVDQYFRFTQGQVWLEVLNYLERVGVNPLGTDGELLLVMSQRHRGCAVYVQERQKKILREIKKKELIAEQKEFIRIRSTILNCVLAAVEEMDYIRRTTDEMYRLKRKKQQVLQINKALHFPIRADVKNCYRTFNDTWNVTPITNQSHLVLNYFAHSNQKNDALPPISPSTSSTTSSKKEII